MSQRIIFVHHKENKLDNTEWKAVRAQKLGQGRGKKADDLLLDLRDR